MLTRTEWGLIALAAHGAEEYISAVRDGEHPDEKYAGSVRYLRHLFNLLETDQKSLEDRVKPVEMMRALTPYLPLEMDTLRATDVVNTLNRALRYCWRPGDYERYDYALQVISATKMGAQEKLIELVNK